MNTAQQSIHGHVRVDESVQNLAARLLPGDIAVIDEVDLDRSAAVALVAKRPLAVLNVASSTTGRMASAGAQMLVGEGIVLIDDLGPDLMMLREGDHVTINGNQIVKEGQLIAEGQLRDSRELSQRSLDNRGRLGYQVQAFASGAHLLWQKEHPLLLDGDGVPRLDSFRADRPVFVVSPGANNVRKLRPLASDVNATVVAVGEGAKEAHKLGRGIDVLIGAPMGVPENLIRRAKHRVLIDQGKGVPEGKSRLDSAGLNYEVMVTAASPSDAAILLADVNQAKSIVTVGQDLTLESFFDEPAGEQMAGFFIQTRARSRVVSAAVARDFYRPRIPGWLFVLLFVAALLVMGVALWLTPWGQSVSAPVLNWVEQLLPWSTPPTPGG